MKKRLSAFIIALSVWPITGHAENLLQVFRDALKNDPQYQAAEAQMLATQQLIPIVRGALLPNIGGAGNIGAAHINESIGNVSDSFNQKITQYSLTANQIIFNYATWSQLKNASAQAKQAQATYDAALQDLMIRVANAYFDVLRANDVLSTTQAQKRSLAEQLRQTEEQFKVGLIAVTGVDQVKASYDATVALEISNKNTISDKLEELRAITGIFYTTLMGTNETLPLIAPEPNNINAWVRVAAKQNYTLLASKFAMDAAKANISVQQAGHLPTVTATGSYNYLNQSDTEFTIGTTTPLQNQTTGVSLNATLPVFSGGTVTAQTRQASYQYAQASATMEQTYRTVLTQTRESYLGVISGISQIKADKQSIRSNESSLAATKAGYTVGTNTILDVLQQQSSLYNAQTSYTIDQYNYLINTLTLKQAAGTLSENDIKIINSWLKKKIDFSAYNFDVRNPSLTFNPEPNPIADNYDVSYNTNNAAYKPDIPAPMSTKTFLMPPSALPTPTSSSTTLTPGSATTSTPTQPSTTTIITTQPTSQTTPVPPYAPTQNNTSNTTTPTSAQPSTTTIITTQPTSQPTPVPPYAPTQNNTSNVTAPTSAQPSTTTTTITTQPASQPTPVPPYAPTQNNTSNVAAPTSTQPVTTTITTQPASQPTPVPPYAPTQNNTSNVTAPTSTQPSTTTTITTQPASQPTPVPPYAAPTQPDATEPSTESTSSPLTLNTIELPAPQVTKKITSSS